MEYRIGIDMGGTDIKAGLVDGEYNIVLSDSTPTLGERPFEAVVADMAMIAERVAKKAGYSISDFPCIGVGSPSCINPKTGLLVFSNNTAWRNVPLKQEMEKHLNIPVFVGNDANCAVLGEKMAGAGRGHDNIVMLTLGTGVGGGVIINGKLYCGGDGMGTELGHTSLFHGGVRCTCGIEGCLESYASVTGLIAQTKAAMEEHPESAMHEYIKTEGGHVTGRTSFDCARKGDIAAFAVVDNYINYVTNGVGNLINIFRPDIFILGGGLSNAGDFLIKPIRERVLDYVFAGDIIGAPDIVAAQLGNAAGTIGAAYLDEL